MLEEPTSLRIDDPGVRALFTEAARFQSWLDVEAALAQAQAELAIIPQAAAREITRKAHLKHLDLAAVRAGLAKTGHPLVPLVWELDRACEGDAGGYVHWGATTQNVTQTGQLLQVRRAHDIFLRQLARILTALADLAERTKDAVLPGRTHGQHAVPATFGFKVAVWIDELCRHVERLRGCEPRVFVAMLGGGAGTLASLGEAGLATQEKMAATLGMRAMLVPARTIGDHQAEYVTLLGMLAATCSKIGREVYTLMKQEFGEVEEPVPPGTVGSSTMPQKRNPKLSQDIIAAAAQIRVGAAGAGGDADRARGRPHHEHHDEPGDRAGVRADRRRAAAHDRALRRPAGVSGTHARQRRALGRPDHGRGAHARAWQAARAAARA
jgi:3-carboxy-cis,cis-muconate cycloisomerase